MDIHTWFGLSYSTHLVLDPARTMGLPDRWHITMNTKLTELQDAFPDLPTDYTAIALQGIEALFEELDDEQLQRWDITFDDSEETGSEDQPYSYRGESYGPFDRMVFPTETEDEARAAGRMILSRTLLQSMPETWQDHFTELLRQVTGTDSPDYTVRFYREDGVEIDDPLPGYARGRTQLTPVLNA